MSMQISWSTASCCHRALRLGWGLVIGALLAGPAARAEESWRAPRQEQSRRNPLPASAAVTGIPLFATYCATCHGSAGKGDGIAAAALYPRPRDLTSASVQKESDGTLYWKITSGRGAMPAWPWLSDRKRWALVWAIRELGRAAGSAAR